MLLRSLTLTPLLISLFFNPMMGQSSDNKVIIEGHIIDLETNDVIPYVNVYFQASNAGVSADAEGNFSLQLNGQSASDTLVFSAIGYKTFKLSLVQALNLLGETVYLQPDILSLDEVTVSALPAVEIIKLAMSKRKDNYGISPHKLSGVYRIADQENGAYARLLETAVDIYDPNYLKKNSRVVDYRGYVKVKTFALSNGKQISSTREMLMNYSSPILSKDRHAPHTPMGLTMVSSMHSKSMHF